MNIVVTGGTGFIGRALVAALRREAHDVVVLSRNSTSQPPAGATYLPWDPGRDGLWRNAVAAADAVVNLAGEPIAEGRWTADRKQQLLDSRLRSTRALVDALSSAGERRPVLVSASGVGYYGPSDDRVLDERAPLGTGFLAGLSAAWEAEAMRAGQTGVRVVLLRIGMVLDRDGGALAKMMVPFRLGVGGPVLPGSQWISWIHRQDLVGLIQWALADSALSGPVNAVAPEAVMMRTFCETLGRALHRPSWLSVPGPILRLALGEVASLMTTGQRVIPSKATAGGFAFRYPTLASALQAIVSPSKGAA